MLIQNRNWCMIGIETSRKSISTDARLGPGIIRVVALRRAHSSLTWRIAGRILTAELDVLDAKFFLSSFLVQSLRSGDVVFFFPFFPFTAELKI